MCCVIITLNTLTYSNFWSLIMIFFTNELFMVLTNQRCCSQAHQQSWCLTMKAMIGKKSQCCTIMCMKVAVMVNTLFLNVHLIKYWTILLFPTDINECDLLDSCALNATCSNTIGSYLCQCLPGFRGDGSKNCTNIDECQENPDICDESATCTDTQGSYVCQCVNGYSGNGTVCQSKSRNIGNQLKAGLSFCKTRCIGNEILYKTSSR